MPSFEKKKVEDMLRKLYPHLWPALSEKDISMHRIECASLLIESKEENPKTLSEMTNRFRETFN